MRELQGYPQRIRESILPLSIADNLPEAFNEWRFTGHTEDYLTPCETCQLCGQEDLRYHFEIRNDYTKHTLNVGSHCILRFNLPVYSNGQRLSLEETRKLLDRLTKQMQFNACMAALKELAKRENNSILKGALEYYQKNKKLSPKFAFVVFWRLQKNNIDHHPSFFSINLKRDKYIEDLQNMPTERVHFFWHALTSAQRKKAVELGHYPPR
jgi:hypothetical protein